MSVLNILLTLQYLAGMLHGVWFEVSLRIGWFPRPTFLLCFVPLLFLELGEWKGREWNIFCTCHRWRQMFITSGLLQPGASSQRGGASSQTWVFLFSLWLCTSRFSLGYQMVEGENDSLGIVSLWRVFHIYEPTSQRSDFRTEAAWEFQWQMGGSSVWIWYLLIELFSVSCS